MTEKSHDKQDKHTTTQEPVQKTVLDAMSAEMGRFLDEMQRTQERMFHEGERLIHEQQKMFDASMKMGRAMSSAMLESARRVSGSMN